MRARPSGARCAERASCAALGARCGAHERMRARAQHAASAPAGYAQLVELNAHSLFSKWFRSARPRSPPAALRCAATYARCVATDRGGGSESGKLITQLFARINAMLDDPDTFLCLLIGPNAPNLLSPNREVP